MKPRKPSKMKPKAAAPSAKAFRKGMEKGGAKLGHRLVDERYSGKGK